MKLSFIIVNFNTPTITVACLETVEQFFGADNDIEVILIDNAPVENHEDAFRSAYPGLIYLSSNQNLGFGKANNLGMHQAKGKYLLLLNSDTLLIDDSIRRCIDFMELPEHASVGLLGCRLLNPDLTVQSSFYPFTGNRFQDYAATNNPVLFKLFAIQRAYQSPETLKEVGDVSGAFMFLRREVFECTAGFDPDFFLYCEETEWCRNRISKKYRIVHFPDTQIIHLGGQSAPKGLMSQQAQISQALFWYKCGAWKYFVYIFYSLFNSLYYFATYLFMKPEGKAAAREVFKGIRNAIPYWVSKIPKYKRTFAARPEGLIFEPARNFFFSK
jgi:GT2 family glycosyltransferase